jgi:hypothetical protein
MKIYSHILTATECSHRQPGGTYPQQIFSKTRMRCMEMSNIKRPTSLMAINIFSVYFWQISRAYYMYIYLYRGTKMDERQKGSPQAGSNHRPFAYEASALPLSYRGNYTIYITAIHMSRTPMHIWHYIAIRVGWIWRICFDIRAPSF